jgi:hypothetical protein
LLRAALLEPFVLFVTFVVRWFFKAGPGVAHRDGWTGADRSCILPSGPAAVEKTPAGPAEND